mmetsp:Transcript_32124/g.48138  ORF Transcript_32124/g.48138 Transcript_32124/m.48138 type:complete len:126 (+) Transcript_32124:118-495(+)
MLSRRSLPPGTVYTSDFLKYDLRATSSFAYFFGQRPAGRQAGRQHVSASRSHIERSSSSAPVERCFPYLLPVDVALLSLCVVRNYFCAIQELPPLFLQILIGSGVAPVYTVAITFRTKAIVIFML